MKNLTFTYNESGHLFYLHQPSRVKFRETAVSWFGGGNDAGGQD